MVTAAGLGRRAASLLATAALLAVAGCSLVGPTAARGEPFGDFTVGEFGGIDGRQNILHVRADGVALLISRAPAGGRLSDQKLRPLQTLLTSEQFREEVARAAQSPTSGVVCTDQITKEVTMGDLSMCRTEPCGEETRPTPAFDEVISIVALALRGTFDGPVETTEPPLVPLHLERSGLQDQPRYTMMIDATGRGTMTPSSGGSTQRELTVQQRGTLRLLTQPEFHALTVLLEHAFDL